MDGDKPFSGEAFVQALELGPGDGGERVPPISSTAPNATGDLLLNPRLEETKARQHSICPEYQSNTPPIHAVYTVAKTTIRLTP